MLFPQLVTQLWSLTGGSTTWESAWIARGIWCTTLPTKALTGHSLGATGVQEAIYSLLMLQNKFICASANIEELDPTFADVPIVRERLDNQEINCVMSNSFGFGGTNATLVFKRFDT